MNLDEDGGISRVGQKPNSGGNHMTTALLTHSVFVVEQQATVFGMDTRYDIYDAEGQVIAGVRQVGQSPARKAFRMVAKIDEYLGHKFEVTDPDGTVLMRLERPARFLKSRLVVSEPDGAEIGEIAQLNNLGRVRFGLTSRGAPVGELRAKNVRDRAFKILDRNERRVGSVSKRFEGLQNLLQTEDKYAVSIEPDVNHPLRKLAIAAGIGLDLALHQSGDE